MTDASPDGAVEVRTSVRLQARREDIELHTADGLTLVGELALPRDVTPVAMLLCLHPLPTAGGFMDSHLLRKAADRLPALAQVGVLRFNTRGTTSPRGTSEGTFDAGDAERFDLAAAVAFLRSRGLPRPWLLGWSFGTEIALQHGLQHDIQGAILLSPPLHRASTEDLTAWNGSGRRLVALIPELDDFLRPDEARERFAVVPEAELIAVEGAKHLWVGETFVRRVLGEVVARVNPSALPLPTSVPSSLVADD